MERHNASCLFERVTVADHVRCARSRSFNLISRHWLAANPCCMAALRSCPRRSLYRDRRMLPVSVLVRRKMAAEYQTIRRCDAAQVPVLFFPAQAHHGLDGQFSATRVLCSNFKFMWTQQAWSSRRRSRREQATGAAAALVSPCCRSCPALGRVPGRTFRHSHH